jgi:hypothetical protein
MGFGGHLLAGGQSRVGRLGMDPRQPNVGLAAGTFAGVRRERPGGLLGWRPPRLAAMRGRSDVASGKAV